VDGLSISPELALPDIPAGAAAHGTGRAAGSSAGGRTRQVARDFESLLIHRLMEQMQQTVEESPLLDSPMTKQVQGIFWFYMAQEMAAAGGLGLWRDIERHALGGADKGPAATEPAR